MNPLYNLAISSYRLAVKLAAHKNEKAAKMLAGQARTFPTLSQAIHPGDSYIWIHASSLGEFEQGRPLIEMIKRNHPEQKILLTFFSPSGYEVRKAYKGADIICYLPFDTPGNVSRFLDLVHPAMAVFIKYEFWGNFLQGLHSRHIPTYIISAIFRPTQSFFKPWGGMFRKMLKCYTTIFVQDQPSLDLLATIGIHNVKIYGDTRFDRVTDILASAHPFPLIERFAADSFTLIMGSSWQPDEDIVIPYFNAHPGMKLIIAPHEFDDIRLEDIRSKISRPSVLYSHATEENIADAGCLIIDCFGILSSCYRYAQVAYIGGGFGVGIHNINEAAVYGIPVIFGTNYHKFKEAHDLIDREGAFSVNSEAEFAALMERFCCEEQFLKQHGKVAGDYIHSQLGATRRIYDDIIKA